MKRRRFLVAAVVSGLWCAGGYAAVVVEEHGPYWESVDYEVAWVPDGPQIKILRPSLPGIPFWFEVYDDSEWPYKPATIAGITAEPNIGTVELEVRGDLSQGRVYGAAGVNVLQLDAPGVCGIVTNFRIGGALGSELHPTQVHNIGGGSGGFYAPSLGSDLVIEELDTDGNFLVLGELSANVYVRGPGPHHGNIDITAFVSGQPHVVDISGSLDGVLLLEGAGL